MNLFVGDWGAAELFYRSWGHQPFQFWILQGAFLVILLWKFAQGGWRSSDNRALWVFTLTSALDAWLTSDRVMGVGKLSPLLAQWLSIGFVILGDLRFFWFATPGKPLTAVALAFVTPVLAALLRASPGFPSSDLRMVFFSYELIFIAVLLALLWFGARMPGLTGFRSARTRRISVFVLVYYVFWATADALLFKNGSGSVQEFAWSLRLIANLLYYGGLLPWIFAAR